MDSSERERHFAEAWCDAVRRIGERHFDLSVPIDEITDKSQAPPHWPSYLAKLEVASAGERRFMFAVYQFYNSREIARWAVENDYELPTLDELAWLDEELVSILSRLLNSYRGW